MNADHMAEFLRKAGYKVIRSRNSYWYEASRSVYLSIPPDLMLDQDEDALQDELAEIFREHRVLGLKFSTTRGDRGKAGALYVVQDKEYDLPSLHIKQRPYVRKGLKNCEVREIDFDLLRDQGLELNNDTLGRQKRTDPHFQDEKLWRQFCDAGQSTPGAGAWGSFVEGQLAAFFIYFITDGTVHLLYEMSRTSLMKSNANHALQFTAIREMIRRDDIMLVSGGFESILDLKGLDRYKRYAGYDKRLLQLRVVLRPLARTLLLNPASRGLLSIAKAVPLTRDFAQRSESIIDMARVS